MGVIIPKRPARRQGKHCLQIKYLDGFPVAPWQGLEHNRFMADTTTLSNCPYSVAVIMERARLNNRWATEKWEAKGVVLDAQQQDGLERVIVDEESLTQVLFPSLKLRLERAEAEGYYLNITSPQPKVFVLWRMRDAVARPELLTVSYNEGTRWADSGENVDGVALPAELIAWIAGYVAEHYRPEPRKKPRYASSKDKGVASRR